MMRAWLLGAICLVAGCYCWWGDCSTVADMGSTVADMGSTVADMDPAPADGGTDMPIGCSEYYPPRQMDLSRDMGVRSYLLSLPKCQRGPLPLVIALHGDGSDPYPDAPSAEAMRDKINMEIQAKGKAVFVYPRSVGQNFLYWDAKSRGDEAIFVRDIMETLFEQGLILKDRVLLTGFDGGAAMVNAIACAFNHGVPGFDNSFRLVAVAPMSGPLYLVPDSADNPNSHYIDVNGNKLDTCGDEIPVILFWGDKDDQGGGFSISPKGIETIQAYKDNQHCNTTPLHPTPECDRFTCDHGVTVCLFSSSQHVIWPDAGEKLWNFFSALL